jgi:hypothetical protein
LAAGLVGTLATAETENSHSDFWAMVVVVAGTDVSGSVVGGVTEEVEARVPFFLRSAFGSETKLFGKFNPLIHYHVFIHNRKKT